MSCPKGRVGFEGEYAIVAIIPIRSKLLFKSSDGGFGVGVMVGLVEEAGVEADVGSDVEEDVVAAVAEAGLSWGG